MGNVSKDIIEVNLKFCLSSLRCTTDFLNDFIRETDLKEEEVNNYIAPSIFELEQVKKSLETIIKYLEVMKNEERI